MNLLVILCVFYGSICEIVSFPQNMYGLKNGKKGYWLFVLVYCTFNLEIVC